MSPKPLHVPLAARDWEHVSRWSRLDDTCEGVFDCPHTTPNLTEDGPFVVRSQDIRGRVFDYRNAGRVSEETYGERIARAEPRFGDLLYSREGTYFGIAAEVPKDSRVCLGQRMVLIRPIHDQLDHRFLLYWLNSPVMEGHLGGFRDGSVAERLNMATIRALPVPLLPPPEQREIAAILGALDDKIELNRKTAATLEAMARALYRSWFVDFDPVHAKSEGRAPAHVDPATAALFPDSFGDAGLPVGWVNVKIGDLCTIKGGKQLTKDRFVDGGAFPVFGGAGQMGRTNDSNADGFVITVGRVGAYCGNFVSHRGKAWVNNNASLISPYDGTPAEFLFLALQALDLSAIKKGAAQPFISNGDLNELSTVVSSSPVLVAFNKRIEVLQRRKEGLQTENQTLTNLRDTLLPRLMSGELRVGKAGEQVEVLAG